MQSNRVLIFKAKKQMKPDAKGDDELVRGDGPEHGPDISGGLLEADGEPLKHCVEGEGQHSKEVSEARVFHMVMSVLLVV